MAVSLRLFNYSPTIKGDVYLRKEREGRRAGEGGREERGKREGGREEGRREGGNKKGKKWRRDGGKEAGKQEEKMRKERGRKGNATHVQAG